MKATFFIAVFVAQCTGLSAQDKALPVDELYKRHLQPLSTLDSNQRMREGTPMDFMPCRTVFYRAYIDRKARELRLVGRTCIADTEGRIGFSVDIFKAAVQSNRQLSDKVAVGESTRGNGSTYNDNEGFFDIRFKVGKGEYLFFYHPQLYLDQYDISDLFYPQPVKKRRTNARNR